MKTRHFWMMLLGCGLGTANGQSFSDYTWAGDMPATMDIPAEFKDAQAVIFRSENYNTNKFSGTFPAIEGFSTFRTQMHVKLLTQEAVDEFKRLAIPRFRGRIGDYVQMKFVDVRIRKADGKVTDLTVRSLPHPALTPDDELYDQQEDFFMYEIPDLAIGDELERITVIEAKFPDQGRIVNLYNDYPTLESKFALSVSSDVDVLGSAYNGMLAPATKVLSSGLKEYAWTMKNLPAVPEANAQGSIITDKLPYLMYEIKLDAFRAQQTGIEIKNFADLIWQHAEDYLTVNARKAKMEEFYNKIFDNKTETLSQTEKLVLLNQFVAQKLKIVNENDLEESERGQNIEYFVFNKKATPDIVLQLYRHFFQHFGIEYHLALGKSRYSGNIDINFPSETQVSDYFYIINTDDGKQLIVEGTNGINELPTYLWGTTCYFRDIRSLKATLNKIDFGKDMLLDSKNNKRLRRAQWDINTSSQEVGQKLSIELKGLYSTGGRTAWVYANKADTLAKAVQRGYQSIFKKAEVAVTEATIKQHDIVPPYDFKTAFGLQVKQWLPAVTNGELQLDLKTWWQHLIRPVVNAKHRVLDYHVPFLGTDVEDLVLVFDKEVELSDMANLQRKIDNAYASYECKVSQINPKTIRIESRYTLKQLVIPAADVHQLEEVNKGIEQMQNTVWKFKIK